MRALKLTDAQWEIVRQAMDGFVENQQEYVENVRGEDLEVTHKAETDLLAAEQVLESMNQELINRHQVG